MALAQTNYKNTNKPNGCINGGGGGGGDMAKPTTFHDFLGSKAAPPLATSDLGSERNSSSHSEGIPFRLTGTKRSNWDSQESPLLNKRSSAPVYRVPFGSNRFQDANAAGPSVISRTAADEGSTTRIKGSGILTSINLSAGKQPAGVLVRASGFVESPTMPSQPGMLQPSGNQMTIFYRGQAHVFDNVHPSKADSIMALAGSNGGSWSTSYAFDSAGRKLSEKINHKRQQ